MARIRGFLTIGPRVCVLLHLDYRSALTKAHFAESSLPNKALLASNLAYIYNLHTSVMKACIIDPLVFQPRDLFISSEKTLE